MTVYFSRYTDSPALDYIIGTILILIFLVSSSLNPISFFYHITRDSKLSSRLYALLALYDFLVNIYHPLLQAHHFLMEAEDVSGEAGIYFQVVQGTANFAAWSSQIIINCILFVRFYSIKYPFSKINEKLVWICLSSATLILVVMESLHFSSGTVWRSEIQLVNFPQGQVNRSIDLAYSLIVITPVGILYILGGMTSIYTVILLKRDTGPPETRAQRQRSARIIFILSAINWTVPITLIYVNLKWPREDSSLTELVVAYGILNGMNKGVSVLDPIAILVLSKDMRAYVMDLKAKCCQKICPSSQANSSSPW